MRVSTGGWALPTVFEPKTFFEGNAHPAHSIFAKMRRRKSVSCCRLLSIQIIQLNIHGLNGHDAVCQIKSW